MPWLHQQNSGFYEYTIQAGDSLSAVLGKIYGVGPRDSRYQKLKDYVLAINPHIRDPNQIRAGDILLLGELAFANKPLPSFTGATGVPAAPLAPMISQPVNRIDRDAFWALSWLEHHANYLTIPGSIAFGASGNLLSPANVGPIDEVSDLYADYKAGRLTKGQYDARRRATLNRLKANLGPAEKWLFGNKTTHESIRIARAGGIPATAHIANHANRLNQLARLARGGGIVLTGVGLTAACVQIANSGSQKEKNEIFVESVSGTLTGIIGGSMLGLFLVSNPIGWGTALVMAVGTTVASYTVGKTALWAYDTYGNRVDFVSGAGVDRLCR